MRYMAAFRDRVLMRLIASPVEPNAIDWYTERGDFVFDGLRPKLAAALAEWRLSLEAGCGAVLLDDQYVVANLHVPEATPYGRAARSGLFNTNLLYDGERPVITPYRAIEGYVSPREVRGEEPAPSFELTDGEALAVEAELVLRSLLATRDCAVATRAEERMDAFTANVSDMLHILEYTRKLLRRLDDFAQRETATADRLPVALL